MSERKQVALLLIATNKYKQFVQPLVDSIKINFVPNHNVTVHVFTDAICEYQADERIKIKQHLIEPYKFPLATLYRYKIFDEHKELITEDFAFYSDVDMRFDNIVGDEILADSLLAVHHPGYFISKGWGSSGNSNQSLSFLPLEKRKNYFAGGFQGGKADVYLKACNILNSRIQDDESRNVLAEWHDETHWNWLLNSGDTGLAYKALNPEYCMVEQAHLRKLWRIDGLTPRIIALEKNHEEIRA